MKSPRLVVTDILQEEEKKGKKKKWGKKIKRPTLVDTSAFVGQRSSFNSKSRRTAIIYLMSLVLRYTTIYREYSTEGHMCASVPTFTIVYKQAQTHLFVQTI